MTRSSWVIIGILALLALSGFFIFFLKLVALPFRSAISVTPTPFINITESATPTPTGIVQTTPVSTLTPATVSKVKIYLVMIGDNGQSGAKIGCGDSLVSVDKDITPTQAPLKAALEQLLSIKERNYGSTGLYNSLYQSNLNIDTVSVDQNGIATVKLTGTTQFGGECDNPRFESQLKQTVLQFPTVKRADIFINDKALEQVVSLR